MISVRNMKCNNFFTCWLLFCLVLYTQRYPYDDSTRNKFDRSLGTHSDYLVVDRFIFASVNLMGSIFNTFLIVFNSEKLDLMNIMSRYM